MYLVLLLSLLLRRRVDDFEHFANSYCFVFITECKSAELRKQLERFHADHIAAKHLEPANGDLILSDKSWPIFKIFFARFFVHCADYELLKRLLIYLKLIHIYTQ